MPSVRRAFWVFGLVPETGAAAAVTGGQLFLAFLFFFVLSGFLGSICSVGVQKYMRCHPVQEAFVWFVGFLGSTEALALLCALGGCSA